MFKICLLIALAIAGASAQLAPEQAAAPEPYSYSYEADTHAAAEQRDPSGRVTGYYTLVGDDGRQRRVEYVADEAGFRTSIQTNEVGTKSENPADVNIEAAPPTQEQLAQGSLSGQRAVLNQAAVTVTPQAPKVATSAGAIVQQPYALSRGYGYNGYYGNDLNSNGYYRGGLNGNGYGYGAGYGSGYGSGYNSGYYLGNAGYRNGYALGAGSYNYHTPGQYYGAYGYANQGLSYTNGNGVLGGRYATSSVAPLRASAAGYGYNGNGLVNAGAYRSFQSISGAAPSGYAYGNGYSTVAPAARGDLLGSSNYVVLKKRDAPAASQK